jgi:hypothetical protein
MFMYSYCHVGVIIVMFFYSYYYFMYSNCYVYVFLFLCYVFLLLCVFRSVYSVSLCCSVYCLCVNVYCTAATGCQTIFSLQVYHMYNYLERVWNPQLQYSSCRIPRVIFPYVSLCKFLDNKLEDKFLPNDSKNSPQYSSLFF